MNLRELEQILADQQEELVAKQTSGLCNRLEEELVELDSPLAQVVIGIRRSGKSTLCLNILHKSGVHFAYVNFDDERLATLKGEDLNSVLEVLYKLQGNFTHLFIDEIQNIDEWFLFVNRLLRRGMRVLVSGSNAKLLSGELATHLTGRYIPTRLYPFSYRDYCSYRKVDTHSLTTQAIAMRRRIFDEYLSNGGFPELLHIKSKRQYISTLLDNILKRDIEQRFKVVYKQQFEQLANHILNTVPLKVSYTSLAEQFALKSGRTAQSYVSYLQQAFLLCVVHKFSFKSVRRITGEKLYPVDVALMNNRPDAMAGENLGWRLEVVVLLELLRRQARYSSDVYYYEERSAECDFVICAGRQVVELIQVSYDISKPKTLQRELNGLLAASCATECDNLLLLTDNVRLDVTHAGKPVRIRPVHEWLLEL